MFSLTNKIVFCKYIFYNILMAAQSCDRGMCQITFPLNGNWELAANVKKSNIKLMGKREYPILQQKQEFK